MGVDMNRHKRTTGAMVSPVTRAVGAASRLGGIPANVPRVVALDIDNIDVNPEQARRFFDQDKIVSLAASIEKHGLQQPILVQPLDGDRYRLVAGERRLRAHRHLGRESIHAIISTGDAEEIGLIENLQRVDLNVLEKAAAFQRMIDTRGYTHEVLADITGLSKTSVTMTLAANRLPEAIRAEYPAYADSIAARTLYEIAKTPDQDTQSVLWERAKAGEGVTAIQKGAKGAPLAPPSRSSEPARRVRDALRVSTKQLDTIFAHRAAMTPDHLTRLKDLRDRLSTLIDEREGDRA